MTSRTLAPTTGDEDCWKKSNRDPDAPVLKRGRPTSSSSSSAFPLRVAHSNASGSGITFPRLDIGARQPCRSDHGAGAAPRNATNLRRFSRKAACRTDDVTITKARMSAAQFEGSLPNFFCQQITTRYQSDPSLKPAGTRLDNRHRRTVAYENGAESLPEHQGRQIRCEQGHDGYRGLALHREFSSILARPVQPADSRFVSPHGVGYYSWAVDAGYHFDVTREHSPLAHHGAGATLLFRRSADPIWIDKETSAGGPRRAAGQEHAAAVSLSTQPRAQPNTISYAFRPPRNTCCPLMPKS